MKGRSRFSVLFFSSLSLWERAGVRGTATGKNRNEDFPRRTFSPHPNPLPKGEGNWSTAGRFAEAVVLIMIVLVSATYAQETDRIDAQLTNTPAPTYVIRNA